MLQYVDELVVAARTCWHQEEPRFGKDMECILDDAFRALPVGKSYLHPHAVAYGAGMKAQVSSLTLSFELLHEEDSFHVRETHLDSKLCCCVAEFKYVAETAVFRP